MPIDRCCAICKVKFTGDPEEYTNPYFTIALDGHEIVIEQSLCLNCTTKYISDPSDDGGVITVKVVHFGDNPPSTN